MTPTPCLYPPHPVFSLDQAAILAANTFGGWISMTINGGGVCSVELADGFDATGEHRRSVTVPDFCQIHLSDDDQDDDDGCYSDPDEGSIYSGCW